MSLDSIFADWCFHTAERKRECIAILKHVLIYYNQEMYYQSLVYVLKSLPGAPASPLGPTRPLSPSKPGDPGKPTETLSINLCYIYLISTGNTK